MDNLSEHVNPWIIVQDNADGLLTTIHRRYSTYYSTYIVPPVSSIRDF